MLTACRWYIWFNPVLIKSFYCYVWRCHEKCHAQIPSIAPQKCVANFVFNLLNYHPIFQEAEIVKLLCIHSNKRTCFNVLCGWVQMRLEKYGNVIFFILRSFSGDVWKVIKKFVGRHNIINTLKLTKFI